MAVLILNRVSGKKIDYLTLLEELRGEPFLLLTEMEEGFEAGYEYVETFERFRSNVNVEYRAYELCEKYDVRYVVATSEYDIERAARIRERIGIYGQKTESATAFRDKVIMKVTLQDTLPVPAFRRLETALDVYSFVKEHKLPVVIKPVDGAGSLHTHVIHHDQQLSLFLAQGNLRGFEIEKFVQGEMYTIDGFYHGGRIHFSWPSRYVNDCLSFHSGKQASVIQLAASNPMYSRLQAYIDKLFSVMPMPPCTTFHAEVFHTPDDRLVLCEVASRTGGGAINDLSIYTFGVDMTSLWIKGQCNLVRPHNDLRMIRNDKIFGFVQIPPRRAILDYVPLELPFPWVVNYVVDVEAGSLCGTIEESSDRVAMVIVNGDTEEEVLERMEYITSWIEDRCVWKSMTAKESIESVPNRSCAQQRIGHTAGEGTRGKGVYRVYESGWRGE